MRKKKVMNDTEKRKMRRSVTKFAVEAKRLVNAVAFTNLAM